MAACMPTEICTLRIAAEVDLHYQGQGKVLEVEYGGGGVGWINGCLGLVERWTEGSGLQKNSLVNIIPQQCPLPAL